MAIHQFTTEAIAKIKQTVRREHARQARQTSQRRTWPLGGGGTTSRMFVASEDIDYHGEGKAKFAKVAADSWTDNFVATGDDVDVVNPVAQKLWQGSHFLAEQVTIEGAEKRFVATRAWSATRLRGALVSETSSTIWAVTITGALDGHYDLSIPENVTVQAKVYMTDANEELQAGTIVFVMHDATKKAGDAFEWIVYSSDCIAEGA